MGSSSGQRVRGEERSRQQPLERRTERVTRSEGTEETRAVQRVLAPERAAGVGAGPAARARAMRPSTMLHLQARAGNAAVAGLVSAQREAKAEAGPEDTKSVEGDTDRSEFTDLPAKAESELAKVPPKLDKPPPKVTPPPKPKPAAPKGKKKVRKPPKGPKTRPKGRAGGAGKAAPRKGAGLVGKRAPPLPPAYSFKKGSIPPAPPVPIPYPAVADPAFKKMLGNKAKCVKRVRKHPTAKAESANAQGAAAAPANDTDAQAKAAQSATMATAKPKPFDEDAFVAAVEAALAQAAPRNLEEAGKLDKKAAGMKEAIAGPVSSAKGEAAGDVEEKTKQAPDRSKATPKPVEPMKPVDIAAPAPVGAAAAMPAPVPNEMVDFRHGPAKVDNELAEADVDEKQLAESNEPELTGALEAKKEATKHAKEAPAQIRAAEAKELKKAASGANATEKAALGKTNAKVAAAKAGTAGKKNEAKTKDELARKKVADTVNSIYDKTKVDVEAILSGLSTKVDQQFTAGEARVRALFTADWKRRLGEYKSRRYSGLRGKYRWVRDKLKGLPAAANKLFEQSREIYEQQMKKLVRQIAKTVSAELKRATTRIEQGRKQISDYVGSLKGDLAKVGQQAAADIADKFDDLDSSVTDAFDDLASDLGKRYAESREAVSSEIAAAQEANKGLIDKAIDKVKGAIDTIRKLKDMLFDILARISDVVTRIIKAPIKFLKNFVTAVKSGVQRFAARIEDHLQKGLMGWLLGKLATAGVEIPDSFDVKSILKLVLSVLGMTVGAIRDKFVKRIGGTAFAHLEKGASIVGTLMEKGPFALIDQILAKFGDFEDMVLGKIKEFVVERIVRSGIEFIVGLLNPAAAFIKACKMIYQIVMFFVDRGSEIKEFVDSVIDAAGDIARGGMGGVPEKIEGCLARVLPLAISFLASLLNLGGVGKKIQEIIGRVTKPIHKAIDKVIDGVLKATKPIWGPIAKAYKKGMKAYEKGKAKAKDLYEKGKAKVASGVDAATAKVKGWFKPRREPFGMHESARHELKAAFAPEFRLTMASREELLDLKIRLARTKLTGRSPVPNGQLKALDLISSAASMVRVAAGRLKPSAPKAAQDDFDNKFQHLRELLAAYGKTFKARDLEDSTPGGDRWTVADQQVIASFAGRPGVIQGHLAASVAEKVKQLSERDYVRFRTLLEAAGSNLERAYLAKALAAGRTVGHIEPFAETVRGKSERWLLRNLNPTDAGLRRKTAGASGLVQQYGNSCGPTTVQLVQAETDPIYALWLRSQGDLTTAPDHAVTNPASVDKPRVAGQQAGILNEHAAKGTGNAPTDRANPSGGAWIESDLNKRMRGAGVEYGNPSWFTGSTAALDRACDAGLQPVIVVGQSAQDTAHYCTVLRRSGGRYQIHDPATGQTVWRRRDQLTGGKLRLPSGHNIVAAVALPKKLP